AAVEAHDRDAAVTLDLDEGIPAHACPPEAGDRFSRESAPHASAGPRRRAHAAQRACRRADPAFVLPAQRSVPDPASGAMSLPTPSLRHQPYPDPHHDRTQTLRKPRWRQPWLARREASLLLRQLPRPPTHGLGRPARLER